MDKESRQNYNKNNYENNKDRILEKLKSKVNCEFCNRQISFCNLQKHYLLKICTTTQLKNKYISERKTNI